jgi:glycosyltransferase involved in cell wall biosynthesis
MVLPTLQELHSAGWLGRTYWYSLQPGAPAEVEVEPRVQLRHLDMEPTELQAYGRSKETLWNHLHGLPSQPFSGDDFRRYVRYNTHTADALLEHAGEIDLAYIHDFQLLQVGGLIGPAAPCVLRWHVPFDPRRIPEYTRQWIVRSMESFDTVIVSTRRDLQGLIDAGFTGRVRQVYPHIDPRDWADATPAQVQALEADWGIKADTKLVLMVARMDPMKRHDLAIRAFARVHKAHPDSLLVLVGNGSFSGKLGGHAGKGKATEWREGLERLVAELGLKGAVRFAHWIPDDLLAAAYQRADVVLLPSDIEGFGLTPLEAWRYGRVPILSRGCGAAEIVTDGLNGLLHDAGDDAGLAKAMERVFRDPDGADQMGQAGRATLRSHTAESVNPTLRGVLDEAIATYGTSTLAGPGRAGA